MELKPAPPKASLVAESDIRAAISALRAYTEKEERRSAELRKNGDSFDSLMVLEAVGSFRSSLNKAEEALRSGQMAEASRIVDELLKRSQPDLTLKKLQEFIQSPRTAFYRRAQDVPGPASKDSGAAASGRDWQETQAHIQSLAYKTAYNYNQSGIKCYNTGRYADALTLFEAANKAYGHEVYAKNVRLAREALLRKQERARIRASARNEAYAYNKAGIKHYNAGRYADALTLFEAAERTYRDPIYSKNADLAWNAMQREQKDAARRKKTEQEKAARNLRLLEERARRQGTTSQELLKPLKMLYAFRKDPMPSDAALAGQILAQPEPPPKPRQSAPPRPEPVRRSRGNFFDPVSHYERMRERESEGSDSSPPQKKKDEDEWELVPGFVNWHGADADSGNEEYQNYHGSDADSGNDEYQNYHGSDADSGNDEYQNYHGSDADGTDGEYRNYHGSGADSDEKLVWRKKPKKEEED